MGEILDPNVALLSGNGDGRDGIDFNNVKGSQHYYGNSYQRTYPRNGQ